MQPLLIYYDTERFLAETLFYIFIRICNKFPCQTIATPTTYYDALWLHNFFLFSSTALQSFPVAFFR